MMTRENLIDHVVLLTASQTWHGYKPPNLTPSQWLPQVLTSQDGRHREWFKRSVQANWRAQFARLAAPRIAPGCNVTETQSETFPDDDL